MEQKLFLVYSVLTIFVVYCLVYKNCYLDIDGNVSALIYVIKSSIYAH